MSAVPSMNTQAVPSMSTEMDALINRVTAQQEYLEQALDDLGAIRARYASADGAVTAEVAGSGALVGLDLAEAITRRPAAEVGPLIIDTVQQAATLAAVQRDEIMARLQNYIR
ncbi:YbaB/EbfC family nucleoid-associated protein [Skermania piniformis]|uniref:YbaB/EbfC family nucleoid-associated protein n=1 Tax=Skermania pinensis TaxID=39122 RepID=A0ABX8S692_9ACTN|nr:YbaB/EbfC family nucleoid-associated protein [Skermania piniformis]QXQ13359.1 YbaB/EbfC family nucleoid-associated protein [Skermania piniformis]